PSPTDTDDSQRRPNSSNLYFNSHAEAQAANLGLDWAPPENDDTLPKTDHDRRQIVARLRTAILNREGTGDKDTSPVFIKRWVDTEPDYFYPYKAIEKACWDIVGLAEKLHTEGPRDFPLHDPDFNLKIEKTKDWTFEQRLSLVTQVLHTYKGRCDKVMKGPEMLLLVVAPQEALQTSKTNRVQNDNRAKILDEGRK
ncbi:hypothetical protein M011DRAFT_370594, partial [Sporormia fimetaria CBS 119925]